MCHYYSVAVFLDGLGGARAFCLVKIIQDESTRSDQNRSVVTNMKKSNQTKQSEECTTLKKPTTNKEKCRQRQREKRSDESEPIAALYLTTTRYERKTI